MSYTRFDPFRFRPGRCVPAVAVPQCRSQKGERWCERQQMPAVRAAHAMSRRIRGEESQPAGASGTGGLPLPIPRPRCDKAQFATYEVFVQRVQLIPPSVYSSHSPSVPLRSGGWCAATAAPHLRAGPAHAVTTPPRESQARRTPTTQSSKGPG